MDISNYNVMAGIKQLRQHLYVYHAPELKRANARFIKMRADNRAISRRMSRIIVRNLQEFKAKHPELYKAYRNSI